ncbi:MAG: hypothetical protein B7C24_17425 [Bacteroidetes bacterium 4572_77]|nr:MAG: hypothetical protein B7C24_17425 [Bacteroidetes bacterium 4572_77]
MKVIIAGSRTIADYNIVKNAIKQSGWLDEITIIVSGGARGVDQLALKFAEDYNITTTVFHPDWKKYRKGAGYKRNVEMANYGDRLIAIQRNFSKGTDHMIETMLKMNKKVFLNQFVWF